ncbi:MAG: PHB depolymerase family esterase [Anaerolineae bacterium]|jgi:polyhydroxybutyrate depolymerase|nr:PHB depolymerase family esterase [Anaerolineae bacterium]
MTRKYHRGLLVLGGLIILLPLLGVGIFALVNKTNGELVSGGQSRTYLLHVPPTYDPATPVPLVISIHGFAEWPAHQMQVSHWNDLADAESFIVVYPSGLDFPKRWRVEDVTFIADLITHLEEHYNIDPARIYANGLSNGGGMSYILGCRLAERIAAIGSVAGAYMLPLEECQPARPVPMIAFHGTADPVVPYEGGPSRWFELPFPVIPDWISQRAQLNGCDSTPSDLLTQGAITGIQYTACDEGADVRFYTIEGGGHTWPGGEALPEWLVGVTTQEINATQAMWEFFERHVLPATTEKP